MIETGIGYRDMGIDSTLEKLMEMCPDVEWSYISHEHDTGTYYNIVIEGFDEDDVDDGLVMDMVNHFNDKEYDEFSDLCNKLFGEG